MPLKFLVSESVVTDDRACCSNHSVKFYWQISLIRL